jgi:hypothetical protein
MPFFSRKKLPFNNPAANGLASQSTKQPRPVCTWSAHAPQSGPSPSPFPRFSHTLTATATATAAGELFLFGGYVYTVVQAAIYMRSQLWISPQPSCMPAERFLPHVSHMVPRSWLLTGHVSSWLGDAQKTHGWTRFLFTFLTQVCTFVLSIYLDSLLR